MKRSTRIDMSNLNEGQKDLISEIIQFIHQRKDIPFDMIEQEMKQKFNLDKIPLRSIKDSELYTVVKCVSGSPMELSYQGYIEKKDTNGILYRDPFIYVSGSLEQFEEMIKNIKG